MEAVKQENKMNPEVKAKWVKALRSGEYKQGTGALRPTRDSFCCLGVLCNLYAQEHPHIAAKEKKVKTFIGETCFPPQKVIKWAGLPEENPVVRIDGSDENLSCFNDEGKTFKDIAKAIKEQL